MKNQLVDLVTRLVFGSTDNFLEKLLEIMGLAFRVSKEWPLPLGSLTGYHEQIAGFQATYVFQAAGGANASVIFDNGEMIVNPDAVDQYDVSVNFSNDAKLREFILSESHDVMGAVFENDVQTEGNLNYIFRFAFMARDLLHRFHLDRFGT